MQIRSDTCFLLYCHFCVYQGLSAPLPSLFRCSCWQWDHVHYHPEDVSIKKLLLTPACCPTFCTCLCHGAVASPHSSAFLLFTPPLGLGLFSLGVVLSSFYLRPGNQSGCCELCLNQRGFMGRLCALHWSLCKTKYHCSWWILYIIEYYSNEYRILILLLD